MVLHGCGEQYKLTKKYQDKREKGLLERSKLSDEEQGDLDIEFPDGGGRTNPDNLYIIDSIPLNPEQKSEEIDIREVKRYGID